MAGGFQQQVFSKPGLGVPGEAFDSGPVRSQPYVINSADATNNVVARAVSITAQGAVTAGNPAGTNVYAGIIVNPKAYALYGDVGVPTLTLPNNIPVEVASMGSFIVSLPAAANIGDLVVYDNTTGALETIAPGATLPTGKSDAFAFVDRFTVSAAGLAVATFTKVPGITGTTPPVASVLVDRTGATYTDRDGKEYTTREAAAAADKAAEKAAKAAAKQGDK